MHENPWKGGLGFGTTPFHSVPFQAPALGAPPADKSFSFVDLPQGLQARINSYIQAVNNIGANLPSTQGSSFNQSYYGLKNALERIRLIFTEADVKSFKQNLDAFYDEIRVSSFRNTGWALSFINMVPNMQSDQEAIQQWVDLALGRTPTSTGTYIAYGVGALSLLMAGGLMWAGYERSLGYRGKRTFFHNLYRTLFVSRR